MRVVDDSGRRNRNALKADEELPMACLHCHAPMPANEDLCDQCGYHKVLGKKIDMDGVRREPTETGARAWFKDSLSEGESAGSVGIWAAVLACVLLIVLGIVTHPTGWFIALPLGIFIVWFAVTRQIAKEQQGDAYRPGSLERFFWDLALIVVRCLGFRKADFTFQALKVSIHHETSFDDDALEGLEDLEEIQALDLEGTSVSDDGVGVLCDCKKLQYLVLRGTQVSPDTVALLQKKLRRTWIWH